jgi:hypothetical protein
MFRDFAEVSTDTELEQIGDQLGLTKLQTATRLRPAVRALPGSKLPAVATGGIVTLMGKARSILEEKGASLTEDAPTMVVHDLAGQRMYYTLHRILLTEALTQVRPLPP